MFSLRGRGCAAFAVLTCYVIFSYFDLVLAADIRVTSIGENTNERTIQARFDGPIVNGDADKLNSLLKSVNFEAGSFSGDRVILSMNSDGGSYHEGLRLAKLILEKNVETIVVSGSGCYSACAIAFMGGLLLGEESIAFASRSVESGGQLAFHAPYLEVSKGVYEKEIIEAAYFAAIRSISELLLLANKIQIRSRLIPRILSKSPSEFDRLTIVDDFGLYRVRFRSVALPKRLTRTMVVNLCVNGARWSDGEVINILNPKEVAMRQQSIITQSIRTRYFGHAEELVMRTFVPLLDGAEGSTGWCFVDHKIDSNGARWACRGFNFETENQEKSLLKINQLLSRGSKLDSECRISSVIDPIAGYGASLTQNDALHLLPHWSAPSDGTAILIRYSQMEPALAPARVSTPRPQPDRRQ